MPYDHGAIELRWQAFWKANETFKAVVQLSGFAKTEAERQKAGQLARSVRGVKDVKNDIRIK